MNEKELKNKILKILKEDSLRRTSAGFVYLFDAVFECFRDRNLINNMNTTLFVKIANKEHTTPARVERALRYSISTSKLGDTISECILTVILMVETI